MSTSSTADIGTRLAVDRTRLAQERTMMAWVRTATSLITFGFSFYKFFEMELKGHMAEVAQGGVIGPRGFALLLIGTGLTALLLGGLQHRASLRALAEAHGKQPHSVAGPVATIVAAIGMLATVGVLLRV